MLTFSVLALLLWFLGASGRRLRSRSPSNTVPLQLLPRDANVSTVSGITSTTLTEDRQTYFAVLQLGEVYLRVALDTASSDLWVLGSSCTTSSCTAVPRYPLGYSSPTFGVVNNNQTLFDASYADGTAASGFVARESVTLANITIPDQVFAIVNQSDLTMTDDVSGILGLGFPRLSSISASVNNSTPFFPALAQRGLLDYPLFALSLTNDNRGSLSFGAVDTTIVTNFSKIGWNKVVEFSPVPGSKDNTSSYLNWVTPISAFAVNATQMSPIPTYPNNTANASLVLFDVGTSGIFGPYQDVERIFSKIQGSRIVDEDGLWAIPCDTNIPMSFTIGQQTYTLDPTDYLIGPAAGNPEICLSWPRASAPSGDGIDWQFGGPFLRTVYSIFSYGINAKEAPRIGFYPLKNATETAQASAASAFMTATVATTLPNSLLPTPSITTPSYLFNASIPAPTGGIVSSALATSAYSAIFGKKVVNATSLPGISPSPAVSIIITTDAAGLVTTTTSTVEASYTLGVPPGFTVNAAPDTLSSRIRFPLLSWLVCASVMLSVF